jgi:putative transcriptional regulator
MNNRMEPFSPGLLNFAGTLLAAHPTLLDPNFRRRVVLISAHSLEDGAMGVVINSPLGQTLGEFDPAFQLEPLGRVPLYRGGPVADQELLFTAWQWAPEEGLFRLAFGIDHEQARSLLGEVGYEVRAFLGYAGWGKGQLEEEMAHNSWLLSQLDGELLAGREGPELWREIVAGVSPEMKIQANAPEDPTLN